MKIQRYEYDENEQDYIKQDDGKVYLRSDILPLLNPWRDAEKEKTDSDNDILIKLKYTDGSLAYSVGYYDPILGFYELYSNYFNDCKIVEWMQIPKSEGEE
jgi:hypothetical protein